MQHLSKNTRFSPVKCVFISYFLCVFGGVVFQSSLHNGLAGGEKKKSVDMNDKNTLEAEMENFQLICTIRKAFVFSWKIHLDSS